MVSNLRLAAAFGLAMLGCGARTEGAIGREAGSRPPDAGRCNAHAVLVRSLVDEFCMDRQEVTAMRYADFLDSAPDVSNQQAECSWNESVAPRKNWPRAPQLPVTDVDWCDAAAFCAWAGGSLCGRVGGGSVPTREQGKDPSVSRWMAACSRDGALTYPYGDDYEPNACNGGDPLHGNAAEVGSHVECEGGFPGLFDLSGNVAEWEDGCDDPITGGGPKLSFCLARGGYSQSQGAPWRQLECGYVASAQRADAGKAVGFRCCYE